MHTIIRNVHKFIGNCLIPLDPWIKTIPGFFVVIPFMMVPGQLDFRVFWTCNAGFLQIFFYVILLKTKSKNALLKNKTRQLCLCQA